MIPAEAQSVAPTSVLRLASGEPRIGLRSAVWLNSGLDAFPVVLGLAEEAERRGFDAVFFGDRMLAEVGHGGQGVYNSTHTEIFTTLAAIAARTTHVLLGSLVLVVPFRHPVPLAKTVASLDLLSRGRLLLGVGAGWSPTEFEVLGVDKRDAAEIMEESTALMKQLWTGARVTFAGRFHRVDGVAVEPTPFHPGGPPIWVGGFSPLQRRIWEGEISSSADAALRRVGRMADTWVPLLYSTHYRRSIDPGVLGEGWSRIKAAAHEAGRVRRRAVICLLPLVLRTRERPGRDGSAPRPRRVLPGYLRGGSRDLPDRDAGGDRREDPVPVLGHRPAGLDRVHTARQQPAATRSPRRQGFANAAERPVTATAAARVDLGPLLAPSSIAVVGASADEAKPGGRTLAFLQRYGYLGRIYPINPRRSEIAGLPTLASLEELPESVDLVIFAIAAAQVPDGLEKAGRRRGARSAIVFRAGSARRGLRAPSSSAGLWRSRSATASRSWGRTASGTSTSSPRCRRPSRSRSRAQAPLRLGPIGFISQSGAMGGQRLSSGSARASESDSARFISTGNEAMVGVTDVLKAHRKRQAAVRAAHLRRRACTTGSAFVDAVLRLPGAAPGKDVVLLKVGTTDVGLASRRISQLARTGRQRRGLGGGIPPRRSATPPAALEISRPRPPPWPDRAGPPAPELGIVSMSGGCRLV